MSVLLRRVRSNLVSYLALFVALGGTSYAVASLPANSVGSRQIKNSAVSSAKVKDRSLLAKDFRGGQLPRGAKGDTGRPGTDASINGVPASGDLSGHYPNPSIAPAAPWTAVAPASGPGCGPSGAQFCITTVPATSATWNNRPNGGDENFNTVGFYRDRVGIVHLRGLARCTGVDCGTRGTTTIFNLPPGYRPGGTSIFTVFAGTGAGRLDVRRTDGSVALVAGNPVDFVSLDGIAFRAEG